MRPSDTVLRRVMRRRRRRPAAAVDHIKADDGPEFEALVKHIANLVAKIRAPPGRKQTKVEAVRVNRPIGRK
jgi:hypothetical protein